MDANTFFFYFLSGLLNKDNAYINLNAGLTSGAYFLLIISLGGNKELTGRRTSLSESSLSLLILKFDILYSIFFSIISRTMFLL